VNIYSQERSASGRGLGRAGGLPGAVGGRLSNAFSGSGSTDSLEHRDKYEDSITIYFQLPFTVQRNKLDSSIIDFTKRFPIPAHHVFLGNNGTATRSILFNPIMQSGWDHGMHAFDAYRWGLESIRFFNTTKPYTELAYMLGGKSEQIIELTHTQNLKPNWNILFQYRLINSPGFFKNQKTNHNDYTFTSWYQSVNKRYNNYIAILANAMQSDEGGGLDNTKDYLNDPIYNDRFNIPTKIGGDVEFGRNFFSSTLNTGNRYADLHLMLKQQYDLGKKDSLVSDSTIIPLFYPRLRFEHVFRYSSYKFKFIDEPNASIGYMPDSLYYANTYNYALRADSNFQRRLLLEDRWKEINNEFSIYTFPDAMNQLQFLKVGIVVQNLKVTNNFEGSFYNLIGQGEYRNKTRNRKWDILATGKLHFTGFNAGDYNVNVNLKRFVGKRAGYVDLGFKNVNRTPSFVFDERSSFYLDAPKSFNKENTTLITASLFQPQLNLILSGNYFLVSNYTYYTDYYKVNQENALFNLLQVSVEKRFKLGKRWIWHSDVYFQQKTGDVALNVPLIFTRNRIGYEGTLGFKKLNIAVGLEIKYHTPYKADGYSPALGKFFYQDSVKITNRPDIIAYLHFRIRNFRAFFRVENLNTVTTTNGFGFRRHNFAAPDYPYPGMNMRLGIYWSFVN
jgi:Putative porin